MSDRPAVRELFVWYRIDERSADVLRAEVEAVQRSLEARFPGLRARLLIRREAGRQTWMEAFARAPCAPGDVGGVDATIEAAIASASPSVASLLASERHVEAFEVVERAG